jgi:hypothetical protein
MFLKVLRIRIVFPGPDFPIPDQEGTGSRIPDPVPKYGFLSTRIQMLDPRSKKKHWIPDLRSGSATLVSRSPKILRKVLLDNIFYLVVLSVVHPIFSTI